MVDDSPDVVLKPIDESDIDFCQSLASQPEVREHQPLKQRTVNEFREEVRLLYSEPDLSHPTHPKYKWTVINEETGEKAGIVSFDKLDLEHKIGRIGYTISKKFWGRGFGTAAVAALIQKIFLESDIERIEADCSIHNPASVRILEKNGFGLEGIKRSYLQIDGQRVDHFSFGLLRFDWEREN